MKTSHKTAGTKAATNASRTIATAALWHACPARLLEVPHRRDDLAGHALEGLDLGDVLHATHDRRDPHLPEPLQALDRRADVLAAITEVETEHAGLLDLVVVPLLAVAVTLEHVQLARALG